MALGKTGGKMKKSREEIRQEVARIVARYQGVSEDSITDDTKLGDYGMDILTAIAIRLRVSLNCFDFRTETVGMIVKKCIAQKQQ